MSFKVRLIADLGLLILSFATTLALGKYALHLRRSLFDESNMLRQPTS
jgi:hypothetical protein